MNISENLISGFKSKFLDIERQRLVGKLSNSDAEPQLITLLNETVAAGQTIRDRDERASLQRVATRIGHQIQRLGLLCPTKLIEKYSISEVGCKGLVIVSGGLTPVSQIVDDLRDSIGVSFDLRDLTLASGITEFNSYEFVVAVIGEQLDNKSVNALTCIWESVIAADVTRSLYIDQSCLSAMNVNVIAPLSDLVTFTDEKSLRNSLQMFLLPLVTEIAREVVSHGDGVIPDPPEPYVAHPYGFVGVPIGRQDVFNTLNDLFSTNKNAVVVLRAIGGAGKTSVAWEWFRRLSRHVNHEFDGILWWSFYEAGASYERFLAHAVAYLQRMPLADAIGMSRRERERHLFEYCQRQRVLFILDGFERELVAYSEVYLSGVMSTIPGEDDLSKAECRCANPWLSHFLQTSVTNEGMSLLITSRVFPSELDDHAIPIELPGLTPRQGEIVWRGIQPGQDSGPLHSMVDALGGHPLAIRVLAAAIAADPVANGDLEKWLDLNAYQFNDVFARVSQRTTHVLKYAMQGLGKCERRILEYASCCHSRLPVAMVKEFLSSIDFEVSDQEFEHALEILQIRGLLGTTNTLSDPMLYLHPIVAGAVKEGMSRHKLANTMEMLREKFRQRIACETSNSRTEISEDMVNLLHTAIQLGDYSDAANILETGLADQLLHRCSDQRRTTDVLFPMLAIKVNEMTTQFAETAYIFNVFGISSRFLGDVTRSSRSFEAMIRLCEIDQHADGLRAAYYNDSSTARASGKLQQMFSRLQHVIQLAIGDETFASQFDLAKAVTFLGRGYALIDRIDDSLAALAYARKLFSTLEKREGEPSVYCFNESAKHFAGVVDAYEAESQYLKGDAIRVRELAKSAIHSANENNYVVDFIRGKRLLAAADLLEDRWDEAIARIDSVLSEARLHDRTEEELALHVLLARALLGAGRPKDARDSIREPLSFPMLDSMNVLACEVYLTAAESFMEIGETDSAALYAKKAFYESHCEGAPFYIARVNKAAASMLKSLDIEITPAVEAPVISKVPTFLDISKTYSF